MQDMLLMSRDECIARIINDSLEVINEKLLPLYLKKTGNVEAWLSMRAIDEHRANSRLLKKALRLKNRDDISTVLHFNAVTITDTYWTKPADSSLTYEEVRFSANHFDNLALRGDADSFNQKPSRTPELTNTGSFEKCWRLIDGRWWMYKAGNARERFSEVFASHLAKALDIDAVEYEPSENTVRCRDFTDSASVNFETAYSMIGEKADYREIYDELVKTDKNIAESYVKMCYFDALIFNMDRHEHNFGVLRNADTGEIIKMAPLYDHNIALIARGYPKDIRRGNDRLIADFTELVRSRETGFVLPVLTKGMIEDAVKKTGIPLERSAELSMEPEEYVIQFILNGQERISEQLSAVEDCAYMESGLPAYLLESLENMKAAWKKLDAGEDYIRWDCDFCQLQSDINSAEVDGEISSGKAWYLREKYLRIKRPE